MKITWSIEKKRGNFRAHLKYSITLEDYEKEIAVNTLNIVSSIPKIDDSHESFCLPSSNERSKDWQPKDFHMVSTPYFRDGHLTEYIRLPFREDGKYPEIEETFSKLRAEYEKIVQEAYGSVPISENKELDTSEDTKQIIAAHLVSRKMLAFCTT